ncbi:Mitotic exit network component [Didymosphaeria variabile]|uniref:Mitotic exit network component n=1 Tax=Didymosphaeria variabile TaxID=1932322 RepID=A0A9W9CD66_9PLEO|nr:Mitotic exit network component [Didymosphaeria variabile]KAJ4356142.1 Mitotic exit network component [Didymosphaeria variabile]
MFVPPVSTAALHASHSHFPARPKPLQPVFTFAQSQSCMYLGMDMLDRAEKGDTRDAWAKIDGGISLLLPQTAYKSPLQRAGKALRTQQAGAPCASSTKNNATGVSSLAASSSALDQVRLPRQRGQQTMAPDYSNYSYKSVPAGQGPSLQQQISNSGRSRSGKDHEDGSGIGTISNADTNAQAAQSEGGISLLSSSYSNPRTQRAPFKPQKSSRGTSSWQLKQYAEATLGSGSLRKAVKLPEGEDKDEWLAVEVVDFYNQINLLYGSITEFCSPQSCPEMKATDEFEYLWQDNEAFKKPTKMSAPEYIEHLMAWIQANVDNEAHFPSRIGVPFPKSFASLIRNMFKRLYRVYAHIYCHHYPVVIELGLEPHLNTSFKHYVLFIDEHGLASGSKDFWGPLGDLVESMLRSD